MARETQEEALKRWASLEQLQDEYASFATFLDDCMAHLGFRTSPVQYDIGNFLAYGPTYSMVQAQRGQAKTTITAAFAVWSLIHDPKHRVLILSAGGKQANEISTLIVRLITTMDHLACLCPDASNGDRTSVEAFDVHYTLKGVDKSPSVACVGITGNLQGKRADLLVADDIESQKNSKTALMREQLLELTRDFTSINALGKIVYLGTPQTQESIYNTLAGRGFTVRIWPGRYPTQEQLENYGDMLAPFLLRRLLADPSLGQGGGMLGDQGKPVDPGYLTEEVLQKKELDQGPAYFQLQHMLNTKLTDAMRYPLKSDMLVMMDLRKGEVFPLTVTRGFGSASLKDIALGSAAIKVNTPHEVSADVARLQGKVMYIDPAGGGKNGDETGYAITGFLNGNVYWLSGGGMPGGYSVEVMEKLAKLALEWKVNKVIIEKNMGYGAFREVFQPILLRYHKECAVEDDMVHGQKELRIIETLEPVMARGALIVNSGVFDEDRAACERHEPAKRNLYSVFHQMTKITRERECLFHDDRLDALEGAVRYWVRLVAVDQQTAVERMRQREWQEAIKDPLGRNRYASVAPKRTGSLLNKRLRR